MKRLFAAPPLFLSIKKSNSIEKVVVDNVAITDNVGIANMMNSYFVDQPSLLASEFDSNSPPENIVLGVDDSDSDQLERSNNTLSTFEPVTLDELKSEIKTLSFRKKLHSKFSIYKLFSFIGSSITGLV